MLPGSNGQVEVSPAAVDIAVEPVEQAVARSAPAFPEEFQGGGFDWKEPVQWFHEETPGQMV